MRTLTKVCAGALLAVGMATNAHAIALTLGGPPQQRTATLADASAGFAGTGNATAATVEGYFNSLAPWTERGSVEPPDGTSSGPGLTDGWLTLTITSGSFGGTDVAGTWTINNASFWSTYANAAISMHVGNGGGDPDHFVWLLTQGETTGTWSYEKLTGTGGGLSNMKLYSSGRATNTPDGGSMLLLLGGAVTALGFLRRKISA